MKDLTWILVWAALGVLASQAFGAEPPNQSDDGVTMECEIPNPSGGTMLLPAWVLQSQAMCTVTVKGPNNTRDGWVQGWVDFNADGDFDDEGEHLVIDLELKAGSLKAAQRVQIPVIVEDAVSYAAFRIASRRGLTPYGTEPDGEIEGYRVILDDGGVTPTKKYDYNDLPEQYISDDVNIEPRHDSPFEYVLRLGADNDLEIGPQPSPGAAVD